MRAESELLQGDVRLEESASESGNLWWPQLQSGPGWAVRPAEATEDPQKFGLYKFHRVVP